MREAHTVRCRHRGQSRAREVKLNLGGSIHHPTDPVGKLPFTALALVAAFEADLTRMPTREGMKIAKAKGRLRGEKPKLSVKQEARLVALDMAGEHTSAELAELSGVARSTVYRAIGRAAGVEVRPA
jgi:DNA invertase Pin-like site-specific DNA recombinase